MSKVTNLFQTCWIVSFIAPTEQIKACVSLLLWTSVLPSLASFFIKQNSKALKPEFISTMVTTDFDYREYYTNEIVPLLAASTSFLGNCDYDIDFYCSLRREGQLASHVYVDRTADQEMTFLVFGEVAPFHRGTKLGAQGNHYLGKPGEAVCIVSQTTRKIVTDVSCSLCQSRINRLQKIY